MMEDLQKFVQEFADNIAAQSEAIARADSSTGNRHADKALSAFAQLCLYGDKGRDALASLFTHPRPDVRVTAAAFLLRHRTAEALQVLEEVAGSNESWSFNAQQAILRWNEGTWALDPADPPDER